MVHQNRSNFRFWLPVQIWNDLWPIILCNLKTKHRRYIKLYIFLILMTRQTIWHYLQRNQSMFQFSTHMELSRSMATILEMPQYVAYQKNVVYAFIKLSAKSHSLNILCTMDGLSCPTISSFCNVRLINPLGSLGAAVWQPQRTHRLSNLRQTSRLCTHNERPETMDQKYERIPIFGCRRKPECHTVLHSTPLKNPFANNKNVSTLIIRLCLRCLISDDSKSLKIWILK